MENVIITFNNGQKRSYPKGLTYYDISKDYSLGNEILGVKINNEITPLTTKVTKDVEQTIKQAGEDAVDEAGVFGLHPELIKTLGRLKYRTSYGQNCLKLF